MTPRQRDDRSQLPECVGDQCNSQGCDGVVAANCESFLHLIFDRIGGGRGSVCATGHRFDAIFRSEITEGVACQALQPSALPECRMINAGWGIPSTRAIAGAKLQSDLLVAIGIRSGVPVTEFGCAGAGGAATVATLPLRNLFVVAIDRGATDPAGSLERCRKNLMMRVPLPWRCFSKSTIERYRLVPNRVVVVWRAGNPFAAKNFAVHADDQHLLVVGPIEDADPPALR